MPGLNAMGPLGAGPMTGRGRGYCMSYVRQGAGFVPGFSRGGRRGRRNRFYATGLPRWARCATGAFAADEASAYPFSDGQDLNALRQQASYLENALNQVKKIIKDMETNEKK